MHIKSTRWQICCRNRLNCKENVQFLKNFKEIMENYLKPTSNGRRIVFPKDFADIAAFTTTCDWCVYNRIFVSRTAEWGEMEEGILDMSTYYYEANPASVLLDNINAARQTWNYG